MMFNITRAVPRLMRLPSIRFSSTKQSFFPEYKLIDVSYNEKGVVKILFDKEKSRNCLCFAILKEIIDALHIVERTDELKITAVGGKGKFFTGGIDLDDYYKLKPKGMLREKELISDNLRTFLKTFLYHKKPLIGAYNGPAIGAGTSLLTWFDYNICADNAFFIIPFVNYGMTPVDLTGYYLPRILGHLKAKEILMFGRPFNAKDAKDMNLVNEVIDHKKYWEVVDKRLDQFVSLNQDNMKEIKRVLTIERQDEIYEWSCREIDIFVDYITRSNFYEDLVANFCECKIKDDLMKQIPH
uniref:3-hydroxyisobutyryl-CoA hydrolase, mitochondrial n=1 Tax=Parastrongyloides trichosuri TaxID=131310 RepID=A0A0N5A6H0_PARTI